MKKTHLLFSFFLIISIAMVNLTINSKDICFADENIDVEVDSENNMYGGTQNFSVIYQTPNKISHLSSIQSHPDTNLLTPPRAIYLPRKLAPWYEVPFWKAGQLYTKKKVLALMKKHGDIVQRTGKIMTVGPNNDPVHFLTEKAMGKNDIRLGAFQLETPVNGFLEEAVLRLVSLAKSETGSRRMLVEYELQLKSESAGNALGAGSGSSYLGKTTALAFAADPQFGKSESRVYNIWHVEVRAYNDGSVPIFPALAKAKTKVLKSANNKKDILSLMFFDHNGLNQAAIAKNVQWLEKRWPAIQKKGLKIEFTGLGLPGLNLGQLQKIAREGMVTVGSTLYTKGYKEKDLENTFRYRSQTIKNPKLIQDLRKRKKSGVVVIKITAG